MDLVFYVSAIKIDVVVIVLVDDTIYVLHHVNMQLIKYPQLAMSMKH